MKLPVQAQPINRQATATKSTAQGILPSDSCCGSGRICLGPCICVPFGGCGCQGVCVKDFF